MLSPWNQRVVTINAATGDLFEGAHPVVTASEKYDPDLKQLLP